MCLYICGYGAKCTRRLHKSPSALMITSRKQTWFGLHCSKQREGTGLAKYQALFTQKHYCIAQSRKALRLGRAREAEPCV